MAANPFLANIPVVSVVTAVRVVNGVEVETPIADCTRVWGRVGTSNRANQVQPLIPTSVPLRLTPTVYDMLRQKPYGKA